MAEGSKNESVSIPTDIPVLKSTPLRDDLVTTAVKFLQNPKVQSSPLQQKRNFMKKKGLTEEEIDNAIKLAGVTEDSTSPVSMQQNLGLVSQSISSPPVIQETVSLWTRFREYSSIAILAAGIIYGLYSLYKKFIEPLFLSLQKENGEKLSRMEKRISDLDSNVNKTLQDLQVTMKVLQTQISDQNLKLAAVSSDLADYKENALLDVSRNSLSVLQTEVTSIKALLLGTKQFPSAPAIPPVIPSWQMKSSGVSSASNQEGPFDDEPQLLQSACDQITGVDQKLEKHSVLPVVETPASKSDLEHDQSNANRQKVNDGRLRDDANVNDNIPDTFLAMNGCKKTEPLSEEYNSLSIKSNQNHVFDDN